MDCLQGVRGPARQTRQKPEGVDCEQGRLLTGEHSSTKSCEEQAGFLPRAVGILPKDCLVYDHDGRLVLLASFHSLYLMFCSI